MSASNELLIAVNTIEPAPDGSGLQVAETGELFDAELYSRLKYGSLQAARTLGRALGHKIVTDQPEFALNTTSPEAAVVYKAIPPACLALSRYCIDVLNEARTEYGFDPAKIVQIHKSSLVGFEYAASQPKDREKVLDSIDYDNDGHTFTGKPVLVVDDIRITGTAERRTRRAIQPERPSQLAFGYVALFNESEALRDAAVEDRINHSYIHDLNGVLDIIRNDGFMLNIRTLKRILSPQEAALRDKFFDSISDDLLYDIYFGAISSGPAFVETYAAGVASAKQHINDRKIIG